MREVTGDLWSHPADLYVVTTNGATRTDGQAIMGRGCAKQIADANPGRHGIAANLGRLLEAEGNRVHWLGWWTAPSGSVTGNARRIEVVSFPVKYHWRDQAALTLIEQSAVQLRVLVDRYNRNAATGRRWDKIVLPRPGCGNGGRDWAEVAPILNEVFPGNQYEIIDYGPVPGTLL